MSKNPATTIVDLTCQATAVANYFFLAAAAGQTAAGFFVDAFGNRTGASFSLSLNQANGSNDALPLPSIPISKGLTRFLPKSPQTLALQTKTLTSFLPISSP